MTAKKSTGRATARKVKAPETVTINIDAISWDDLDEIANATAGPDGIGWQFDDLFHRRGESAAPTYKGIRAFIWLEIRKKDPNITMEEVGKLPFTSTQLDLRSAGPTKAGE